MPSDCGDFCIWESGVSRDSITINWKDLGAEASYVVDVAGPGGGYYELSGKSSLKLTGLPAGVGYVVTVYVTAGGSGVEGMWVETRR